MMDDRELERLVRDTYADMPVPPLSSRRPARRRIPFAGLAAVAAAIVVGLAIGVALPRLRGVPATAPAGGSYAVLFAEGSAERFLVVDADGRTIATMDRGSPLTVSSPAPSPDGHLVAYWRSSVTDAELLVWDVASGHISALFRSGDRVGGAIIWAPDSRSFVTSVGSQVTGPGVPPRTSRLLRVHIDGAIATLMQVTDAFPPTLVAYDGQTVAALGGEMLVAPRSGPPARETVYVRVIPVDQQQQTVVEGAGVLLPSTLANPRSQDGATVTGNFKEFESVEPNDIRVWRIESFAPPIARHLERGAEGALLWPGRDAVLFVRMSGPGQGTLKALRFGGPQRVDELGPTDGVPLALDPSGRWLLTSGPSLHPIDGQAVGAARRLAVPPPMRAIGWVVSGAVGRNPPPTPQPPSCEPAGTAAEDVVRAFLDEVRQGDVNGMTGCWSPGRFTFADASAYARTRMLDSEVERFGSAEARDSEGRLLLGFRVRAGWELRQRSPWRADGGCCERVFLVRQHDGGTWRIDSSQTVSAKVPADVCAARTGLRPEQVVDAWFTLLADERAADMVACWSDTIADRDALMRGYIGAGGVTRLQIGEATPTRSGAIAIRVLVHWRTEPLAWTSGQAKWLIVRRQADGRWAIESTATALAPEVQ